MGEYSVFVVNGNKAFQHKINIGMQINDKVIVREGLQSGDTIVTEGTQRLKDNTIVSLNSGASKTKPGTTGSY